MLALSLSSYEELAAAVARRRRLFTKAVDCRVYSSKQVGREALLRTRRDHGDERLIRSFADGCICIHEQLLRSN